MKFSVVCRAVLEAFFSFRVNRSPFSFVFFLILSEITMIQTFHIEN